MLLLLLLLALLCGCACEGPWCRWDYANIVLAMARWSKLPTTEHVGDKGAHFAPPAGTGHASRQLTDATGLSVIARLPTPPTTPTAAAGDKALQVRTGSPGFASTDFVVRPGHITRRQFWEYVPPAQRVGGCAQVLMM